MKLIHRVVSFITLFGLVSALVGALPCCALADTADLVLRGGQVYTMNAARSWAETVAISGDKIIYVGPDAGASKLITDKTKVIELNGKMVLPSFQDCHAHPLLGNIERSSLDLSEFRTKQDMLAAIRKYVDAHKDREWIVGGGWMLPVFPHANPRKEDLDSIVPDKPVYFESQDGHSAWVNSRTLAMAGINKTTKDPEHGRIERDPRTGEPSGTLRESACDLIDEIKPKTSLTERIETLKQVQSTFNRFGITAVQEAWSTKDILEAYEELDKQGILTLRAITCLYVDPGKDEGQIAELVKQRDSANTPNVRANTIKMFADGVIEAHTAALLEPYIGTGGDRGALNYEPAMFSRMAIALDKAGFQIHIHAIGDRAVRTALDALESAKKTNGSRDSRHVIAHLQLIQPEDRPRFRQLGVVADFQPYWSQRDDYMAKLTEPVLGPARAKLQYPMASMFKSGAVVVGGSDWPVTTQNPLDEIEVAITHRDIGNTKTVIWNPDERINLPDALAAYTCNAAYVNRLELETGSLEVGKSADMVVLDKNLFDIPTEQIHSTHVVLTLLGGKQVYKDPGL